ncbi:uncharacterized protein LOC132754695 [Ruditapes philippinarum]|uniref:uncharacterized protein LOC132754695 n=1 Tax=Ruditapes philippinarum TaxID=129788 RepID=UPI001E703F5C|nr:uncharacterized protein LOC132754695 [Ruditapes philippinarum]UBB59502.1 mitochondrial cytochrome b-c1 complex subunit 10 [Ruditapes philippinarum]
MKLQRPLQADVPFLSTPGKTSALFSKTKFFGLKWAKTGIAFGTVGVLAFFYATDWKVIVKKIPYYRQQFQEEEESEEK